MADKINVKQEGIDSTRNDRFQGCYSKLILLRDCIKDLDNDIASLRSFITNVTNEMYIANEKITSFLAGNQKRLDLLKDLENKVALAEYKKSCYIEEFTDLIPFPLIKDYYNGILNVNNVNKINLN